MEDRILSSDVLSPPFAYHDRVGLGCAILICSPLHNLLSLPTSLYDTLDTLLVEGEWNWTMKEEWEMMMTISSVVVLLVISIIYYYY